MLKKMKIVMFPMTQVLDITGPVSVFEGANKVLPKGFGYNLSLVGLECGAVPTYGCVSIVANEQISDLDLDAIDSIIVPGGSKGTPLAMRNSELLKLVSRAHERGVRVISVCTGAFILAEAGILNGKKCTTHWGEINHLRKRFPDLNILEDVIYHNEGSVWTSAGVSTGMDMALSIVAHDYGKEVSRKVARDLVLYIDRPGNLPQISEFLKHQPSANARFRDLITYVSTNLEAAHDVDSMAIWCNMSTRNFTRKFRSETGTTPAAMVRKLRSNRALYLIENSNHNLKRIAKLAGFSSTDAMRRSVEMMQRPCSSKLSRRSGDTSSPMETFEATALSAIK